MKRFTINDIRKWKPCYDPSEHLPESWQGTALDILNDDSIPFKDRLWVIMRTDLVSERLMRRFAVWCARQVQHLMVDERSIHALDVMEAYAENRWLINDAEYAEAWEDERAAAWATERDLSWSITEVTARTSARASAEVSARVAARDAAWYAAEAAVWDAAARSTAWATAEATARAAQEQKLREMLIAGVKTGDTK